MNAPAVPSPIAELWRWHAKSDLDRRPAPWLVQRADDRHAAEVAARKPLSLSLGHAAHLAESALEEIASGMVSHAERCDANARLAPRLAELGLGSLAEKLATCRTTGSLVRRETDARFVPIPESKCRRPRVCPHCARDESARLRRRYVKRLRQLVRTHAPYLLTVSPTLVPTDRLEWAWRELLAEFDALRRTQAGRNIAAALATVENTVPAPGRMHPHLHAIIAAGGHVSWKTWRRELNRLLRERYAPVVAGDVYYRPAMDAFVRVESVRHAAGAVREVITTTRGGKSRRRVACDLLSDVVCLSDGTELPVAEVLAALGRRDLQHAYHLVRPLTGTKVRVVEVRHAPGADRAHDVLVLESGHDDAATREERTLAALRGDMAHGALRPKPRPMSFQIDLAPIRGNASAVEKSLREVTKYLVKPADLHAMQDDDLLAVLDAGGQRFRRTRAYGLLHGGQASDPGEAGSSALMPLGTFGYDSGRRDVELRVGGRTIWSREAAERARARREAERSGLKGLIPADRSAAVTKALKSANDECALRLHGCYDDGFYAETGPPE